MPYTDDSDDSIEQDPFKPNRRQEERMMEKIITDLDDAINVKFKEKVDKEDEGTRGTFYKHEQERMKTLRGKCLVMYFQWLQHVKGEKKSRHTASRQYAPFTRSWRLWRTEEMVFHH